MVSKVYLQIPLNKSMHLIETSQPFCIEIRLTGFYMIQAFTEWFFGKDFKTAIVLWMPLHHSLVIFCVLQSCMLRWKIKHSSYLLYQ